MRSNRTALIITIVVGLVLSACGSSATSDAAGTATAPAFSAARLGGGELASTSFAGEDTVLWFWAPWCTSCRAEARNVIASVAALDGKINVIGVAGRGEVPAMEAFVSETATSSLTHVVDATGDIWTQYGVATQPAFAFIDDNGQYQLVLGAMGEKALTERMITLARD